MKHLLAASLIMICLLVPANVPASDLQVHRGASDQLKTTLNRYVLNGYQLLGPFQYLGKTLDQIELYRHKAISYFTMDVINEAGEDWFVAKHDFVYVLSKNEDVVLVRIEKEDRDEE